MAIHTGRQAAGFARPQAQLTEVHRLPAPNKGIDARVAYGEMNSPNCIYAYNMTPAENGMLVRPGYREWEIEIESVSNLGVKTLMEFTAANGVVADNRKFAVNNEGIWDVTEVNTTPVLKEAFTVDTTAEAGHGSHISYTDDSGAEFLYYADSKNGLYFYTQTTDTWAVAVGITGVTVANVVFIMHHKQRVWMIEEGDVKAWYMPVGAILGAAVEFFFGSKFPNGGHLAALINWSVDGGLGLDDYLVAISSNGDVLPYQGTDPSSTTTWELRGQYNIGLVPAGRRFFGEYSGELYLLSIFGITTMGSLLRGVAIRSIARESLTYPIAALLRADLESTKTTVGWEIVFVPSLDVLLILTPYNALTGQTIQYAMSLMVEGWGIWRGAPMTCAAELDGELFFGTLDGRAMVMDVGRDDVLLDELNPAHLGLPIEYSILTGYNDAGSPGQFKRGMFIRPDLLAVSPPNFQTKMFFDYAISEQVFAIDAYVPGVAAGLWDSGLWDVAVWGAGDIIDYNTLQGQTGIGRTFAVALRGEASDTTRLISFDVMWQNGGVL